MEMRRTLLYFPVLMMSTGVHLISFIKVISLVVYFIERRKKGTAPTSGELCFGTLQQN